jgi:hypothetical protein
MPGLNGRRLNSLLVAACLALLCVSLRAGADEAYSCFDMFAGAPNTTEAERRCEAPGQKKVYRQARAPRAPQRPGGLTDSDAVDPPPGGPNGGVGPHARSAREFESHFRNRDRAPARNYGECLYLADGDSDKISRCLSGAVPEASFEAPILLEE